MDTKKFTDSKYITLDNVKALKNTQFVVLNAGSEKEGKFGVRLCLLVNMVETQSIKEWTPKKSELVLWQLTYGFDSASWVAKLGKFVVKVDTVTGKEYFMGEPQ